MSLHETTPVSKRSTLASLSEVIRRIGPLGFTSFGGPNVHVLIFRRIFVNGDDPWIDERTFADLFSLSGSLPGPGSTQLLFSLALVRGGALAGLLAFLLWSLPGAIGMFLLSLGVKRIPATLPPLVLSTLTGLNAAAVGLIFCAGLQLTKSTSPNKLTRMVLFLTAAVGTCYSAVWLFPVLTFSGGLVTLAGSWGGWTKLRKKLERNEKEKVTPVLDGGEELVLEERVGYVEVVPELTRVETVHLASDISRLPTPPPDQQLRRRTTRNSVVSSADAKSITPPSPLRTPIKFHLSLIQIAVIMGLFFSTIVVIVSLREKLHAPPRALQLFTNLFIAGSILFGGGPVVVPLLQGYTVTPGWVSSQDFLFGFAILQAFPGPNFNFAVFLGALTLPHNPVLGGVLAFLGLFTPGILLKLALLPAYSRFREHPFVKNSLTGLNAAASGLIWTAVYRLWTVGLLTNTGSSVGALSHSLDKSGYWVSVAGAAVVATQTFGVQPPFVILGGCVAGVLFGAAKGAP